MSGRSEIFADPWLKKSGNSKSLPDKAAFACAYYLDVGIDSILEAALFHQTETTDELWTVIGCLSSTIDRISNGNASSKELEKEDILGIGCVFAVPKRNDPLTSCLDLLDRLFRARIGFYWPEEFFGSGIIDKSAFESIVGQIDQELKENSAEAQKTETDIIKVARELGLNPQPTGTGSNHWQASCPGTNHPLYISSAENSFGCGWCKRKGSVEDLKAFVNDRKARQSIIKSNKFS